MANCISNSAAFQQNQAQAQANGETLTKDTIVRKAATQVIKALRGAKIERFVVHHDLIGAWKTADPNKFYSGLVPVIGGKERFDLSLLTFDLLTSDIPSYPKGDDIVFVTPTDDLHRIANEKLTNDPTYDTWLNAIATEFAGGAIVEPFEYPARSQRGGKFNAVIFGAKKA